MFEKWADCRWISKNCEKNDDMVKCLKDGLGFKKLVKKNIEKNVLRIGGFRKIGAKNNSEKIINADPYLKIF
jgi:hypothetical protein